METPTSTLGLVERVKEGDTQAFSLVFRKYRKRLAVLIHYRMGPSLQARMEVDDILQETFFAASRQLDQFTYESPGSFMAWLAKIADHVMIDAARFQGRQKRDWGKNIGFRSQSNPGGAEPVDFETPSRIFSRDERVKILFKKLDQLSAEQREVILLAKFEGLSTEEIGARLGKTRAAVGVLLHRALKLYRESVGAPQ